MPGQIPRHPIELLSLLMKWADASGVGDLKDILRSVYGQRDRAAGQIKNIRGLLRSKGREPTEVTRAAMRQMGEGKGAAPPNVIRELMTLLQNKEA